MPSPGAQRKNNALGLFLYTAQRASEDSSPVSGYLESDVTGFWLSGIALGVVDFLTKLFLCV